MPQSRAHLIRRHGELLRELDAIAALLAAPDCAEPATYSSDVLPPRVSRRAFRERCAAGLVGGAHKEGRVWICSVTSWHASKATRQAPAVANDVHIVAPDSDAAIIADALAGWRCSRSKGAA